MRLLNSFVLVFFGILVGSTSSYAQDIERRVSQFATVSQRVGVTDIEIKYSRPKVKKREVWGKLVPYGYNYLGYGSSKAAPWRAGANECTSIEFTEDVIVEGNRLKAGKYGLFVAVLDNDKAEVVFSNNSTLWGSYDYKQEEDALRVKINTKKSEHTELLTYEFVDLEPNTTTLQLRWEKKSFPVQLIMTK